MSPEHAFVVWSIMSLGLLLACLPAISQITKVGAIDLLVLVLASGGGFLTLVYGQVTFLVMALFTAAWCADRKGHVTTAGALLGLLTVLKPFFGLFVLYLAWRRQWRAVIAYVAVFLAGMAAGWSTVGAAGFLNWLTRLRGAQWRWHIYNGSVWGIADRLFTTHPYAERWTPLANTPQLAEVLTTVLLVAVAAILWRTSTHADLDSSYALYGLASLLLSPLGWLYYLPAFLGPITVVLAKRPSRWLWPVVALSVWPYLLFLSSSRGKVGTLLMGQWAVVTVAGVFLLVASSSNTSHTSTVS